MKIKSKIEGSDEWLFIEELPEIYTSKTPLSEKHVNIKSLPAQKLINYQLSTGGLFLVHSTMQFSEHVKVLSEVEGETITSQFIFYGSSTVADKDFGKNPRRIGSRHNIRYIPSIKGKYPMMPDIEYKYFLLVLSKAYYFHLIDQHSLLHTDFVREILKGKYTSFAAKDLPVTTEMKRVINDICECKRTGELKRLHTESKILELLMLQLEQMQSGVEVEKYLIKQDDLKKIENAREILDKGYTYPPTIIELSKQIGLNEFKLKRGFKEYYGTTIYGYVTRLRMEEARRLILEERKSIGQVAVAVGFNHQSHLTDAFKRYFGILPSEIKSDED
ncbi:transcriptional regulator, AraC family protein [Pedobacter sp. BAL39]|uniref:helix-turn-helix transcriptional regulator n=1 Tax=Pedobacter sp. BAL39 TaxID=391596 RepID=UPI000155A100|nr:AraC family transcriptional regulator [Pedobacter sp. BAL39]EDM36823.1 transcriptional regulator, AraC family protein [Pedobacter sp. BAL39]